MEQKYIVAIEIGSSKIKGAVGSFDNSNTLTVLAVEEEKLTGDELGDSVRYGVIQNVDKVTGSLQRICRKLESSPNVSPRKIRGVYTSIGGRSLIASTCEVSRQYPDDIEITDAYFEQLKHEARESNTPADKEVIDVVTRECLINNMSYKTNPVGLLGRNIKATFNLITCRTPVKRNINRVINERLGLDINGYIVRPLAEANLVLTDEEKRLGCMLVDFGAETVSAVIYKNGALVYAATLPMGSRNITRDLMTLNFTEERAEETKKVAGNADIQDQSQRRKNPDNLDYTEINNYVAARAGEIVSNILEQINYAELKPADLPGGIVLVGGGAKLKGFSNLLAAQSNMKVRIGSPSGLIRIADGRIQPNDAVDVISILADAVKGVPAECMERPVAHQAADLDDFDDEDDDSESRIGEDFGDNRRKPKKAKKEKKQRRYNDEDDGFDNDSDEEDEEAPKPPRSGFWRAIKDRIQDRAIKLMSEPEVGDDGYTNGDDEK